MTDETPSVTPASGPRKTIEKLGQVMRYAVAAIALVLLVQTLLDLAAAGSSRFDRFILSAGQPDKLFVHARPGEPFGMMMGGPPQRFSLPPGGIPVPPPLQGQAGSQAIAPGEPQAPQAPQFEGAPPAPLPQAIPYPQPGPQAGPMFEMRVGPPEFPVPDVRRRLSMAEASEIAPVIHVAFSLAQLALGAGALWYLWTLAGNYAAGRTFGHDNAHLYERIGWLVLGFAGVSILSALIRWLSLEAVLPIGQGPGAGFLVPEFWLNPHLVFAVIGGFLIMLGKVMAEGAKLAEEAELTV
ncbi:MAG: DUF2975 domain-containing protein [Alphaproteobacteria bacterium]|nr:DUF2975 domain-containing protein [Alphaproteobacteria bacterium]